MATLAAVPAPPGNPRFPLFDSLRAIAALSVLLTHTGYLSQANAFAWYGAYTARLDIGVTVFFLISGFLIYRPFVSARLDGTPLPAVADFFRRRALRIIPAYWLALTVLAFYPGLPQMWDAHSWVYYAFGQVYSADWSLGGLLQSWSLCVEVTFYLSLPLLAGLMRRPWFGRTRPAKARSEYWMLAVLFAAGIGFRAALRASEGRVPNHNLYSTLPGNIDWFVLGMGLAVASVALQGREWQPRLVRLITARPSLCWAAALVLFWAVSTQMGIGPEFPQVYTDTEWLAQHLVYGAAAMALLLPAVFGDHAGGLPRIILRNRVLRWLGAISYGIFLWHLAIVAELATNPATSGRFGEFRFLGLTTATLAIAVACAAASHYLVERPLMRWRGGRSLKERQGSGAPAPIEASGIAG